MISQNPATEELLGKFEYWTDKKAIEEVKLSRAKFAEWSSLDLGERCNYLLKVAAVLKKNSRQYGEIMTKEMGKPIKQAVAEAEKCAWVCEYYAKNAEIFLSNELVTTEAKKSYVTYQPLGTILGIMPWNFPFYQVFRFGAATLAAGNTLVVKHASNVPQCAMIIEEVFREAGFPGYVYRNLPISSDSVKKIVNKDLVEGLSLTGSTEAGMKVGGLAGSTLKKVVLELGGSDPFIVLDEADLEKAAKVGVAARFQNNGQSCIAAKRFLLHAKIAEQFKHLFINEIGKQKIGDPMDEKTDIGPLARSDLRDGVENQVNDAVKANAKILCGGNKISGKDGKGYFFEPTAIEVSKNSKAATEEEIFGPVASVIVGSSDEELIEIANNSQYGLGASVWTNNNERAANFIKKLQSGVVAVNNLVKSDPRIPFGGIKKSGLGRELGKAGILEFVNVKSVQIW
ncbi:NAD-dependent succinate-semialdehyde dehydrogenase [Candidatus Micrarchaeota archaeon]|nr:NAD-dependent succinate-semialdehyde dehydrogenase [Candidatus Micrarchaeota archaeon]